MNNFVRNVTDPTAIFSSCIEFLIEINKDDDLSILITDLKLLENVVSGKIHTSDNDLL